MPQPLRPDAHGISLPQEQAAARRLLQAIGAEESEYAFFGGYEGLRAAAAALFLPDWAFGPEEDAVAALRCRFFYEAGTLNHRDFLGSLMGLGLTREKIGDILVGENSADVLVSRTAEPFLLEQWESAGRAHLQVAPLALADVTAPAQAQREVRDTVSSLRLDSVLSSGFFHQPPEGGGRRDGGGGSRSTGSPAPSPTARSRRATC